MTELLLTFPAEIRKDMEIYLEKQRLDIAKARTSFKNRAFNMAYKKLYGIDMIAHYDFKFLSNTQAQVSLTIPSSPLEVKKNAKDIDDFLMKEVQKKFLENVVKVEVIKHG